MKVSIDGGITYHEMDNVRVIYREDSSELQVNCTHEGLIMDSYYENAIGELVHCGTSSQTVDEIIESIEEFQDDPYSNWIF